MAWFFADSVSVPLHTITDENAQHISRSLRMKPGEELTICDRDSVRHDCVIEDITKDSVVVRVKDSRKCENEPDVSVTLYQALTKGDKMDFIIQKAVELGASEIVPVLTSRCVSRPDEKSMRKKVERWNKIALSAAMQSRRGRIPTVSEIMSWEDAVKRAGSSAVICYEQGGVPMGDAKQIEGDRISLFIGSEGGFAPDEVELLTESGGTAVTLGSRILRAETAPLAALSVIMYLSGNMGNEGSKTRGAAHGGDWRA